MYTPSPWILPARAYDRSAEFDPGQPPCPALVESLSLVEHTSVVGDDGPYERARQQRCERGRERAAIPDWFSTEDLIAAPWGDRSRALRLIVGRTVRDLARNAGPGPSLPDEASARTCVPARSSKEGSCTMSVRMKIARLNLRLDEREDAIIRRAAEETGTNVSEFVVRAATSEAERALGDTRTVTLDPAAWDAFVALLDRPPRENPRLRALFERPDAFE